MTALKYSKPIAVFLISLATSANADLSGLGGSVGGTVGGAVGSVTSSVSNTSASSTTKASASVAGVAAVDLCVGASINSGGGGGCSAAQKAALNVPIPESSKALSTNVVGMPVFGVGEEMVGRVKRVELIDQNIAWIIIETTNNRRVQLTNAIRKVDASGVTLRLSKRSIESRLTGSFTRIRVQ